MSVLSDNHYIQFNDGNNYQEIEIHYDYNPYGYDQNEIHNQVEKQPISSNKRLNLL